jgi:hypothetical protein
MVPMSSQFPRFHIPHANATATANANANANASSLINIVFSSVWWFLKTYLFWITGFFIFYYLFNAIKEESGKWDVSSVEKDGMITTILRNKEAGQVIEETKEKTQSHNTQYSSPSPSSFPLPLQLPLN